MVNINKTLPGQLDGNSRYSIRVRSINSFGITSDWSDALIINTPEAGNNNGGRITLTANGLIAYDENGQTSFVYSGESTSRINYIVNPSFEVDTQGWSAYDSNSTISRSTTDFFTGEAGLQACLKILCNNISGISGIGCKLNSSYYISVSGGDRWTVSCYAKTPTTDIELDLGLAFYNASDVLVSTIETLSPTLITAPSAWTRLSLINIAVPSGATKMIVYVRSANELYENEFFYVDSFLAEESGSLGDYFDGSTSIGATSWNGTEHLSSSTFDLASSPYYVDGGIFTAGVMQTAVDVGVGSPYGKAGVKMSTSGIQGYSGLQATPAFSLDTQGKFRVGSETSYLYFDGTNLTVSGNINAGTIDIGGFDNTSFHVDATGQMWMGGATPPTAPFRVSSSGDLVTNTFNLIGATPNRFSATWGPYQYTNGTENFFADYSLKFSHGPYTIYGDSAIYWSENRYSFTPTGGGLYTTDQNQTLSLVGPSIYLSDFNSPPQINIGVYALKTNVVGMPGVYSATPSAQTIFITTGIMDDNINPTYAAALDMQASNTTGYANIGLWSNDGTHGASLYMGVNDNTYNDVVAIGLSGTAFDSNAIELGFAAAYYKYGQVVLGSGSLAYSPWTVGTRGNSGFSQASLSVIESDAFSNAHLSLRHSNVGTSATDGLDLVVSRSSSEAFIIQRENAALRFRTNDTARAQFDSSGHFKPEADNTYTCGANGNRWSAVWAANGTIQTSDIRTKTSIDDSQLGLDFIRQLRPVSYKFKIGKNIIKKDNDGKELIDEDGNPILEQVEGIRTHYGFIAQEVKNVLGDIDFGGWIKTNIEDKDSEEGLRYDEFIAPLVKAVQQLDKKITNIESILDKK